MRAQREPDLAAFLHRAGALLATDPVLNTVICSVSELAAVQPARFTDAAWITVTDGAEVVGAAMRTDGFPVAITPMPEAALGDLADLVAAELPDASGVTGPRPHADRFAELWRARTGGAVREGRAMRLFRLDRLTPPAPAPGALRNAANLPEHRGLFFQWVRSFVEAVGDSDHIDPADRARRLTERGGLIDRRALWVWCDGEPVSFASLSLPASGVVRVGLVYTPPELRGRGYAGNCVAAVSARVLAAGQTAVLFTDLANPTSNKIYQRMGYRPVTDAAEYAFAPSSADLRLAGSAG